MPDETDAAPETAPNAGSESVLPQQEAGATSPPEPTLAAYYGTSTPKLAEWIKVVRASGTIASSDFEEALQQLRALDPDLRKTLALAAVGNPPQAVRRWIAHATRFLLADRLASVSVDPHSSAHDQIGRIAAGLAPGLRSKERIERAAAENLLRLAIKLLTDARPDFSAGEMLTVLFAPLHDSGADLRLAPVELQARIKEAGINHLRDWSLVQAAALDRIQGSERARSEAQDRANALDASLAVERDRVRELREKLLALSGQTEALQAEVVRLKQSVADHRQIGAHESAELLARMRALLAGRIEPLLADAADALEIEPPISEVAKDRIDSARSVIKGEIRWLDESSG